MKQDNVIQFPKEQAVRVRLRERGMQQKAVLALSILSVLMLSVRSAESEKVSALTRSAP